MKRFFGLVVITVLFLMVSIACSANGQKSEGDIYGERNILKNSIDLERSVNDNVSLRDENLGGLKEPDVIQKLSEYSQKLDIEPREAKLDEESWEIIQKEHSGRKVNIQKTKEELFNAEPGQKIKLAIEKVKPKATARKLDRNVKIIGSYTTRILDRRDTRLENIQLAAKRLDYEKVQPGEEFSFNGVLGKRTTRKGYQLAPMIIKTEEGPKKAYGVGGGICQLSTTLYNAARKADMKITERHSHTKAVGYVSKGKDAMVAYGSSDLKFINNRNHPIMIRVYVSNYKLTVRIYENRNNV